MLTVNKYAIAVGSIFALVTVAWQLFSHDARDPYWVFGLLLSLPAFLTGAMMGAFVGFLMHITSQRQESQRAISDTTQAQDVWPPAPKISAIKYDEDHI